MSTLVDVAPKKNMEPPKKNMGRQKVKMARMEKDSNRQVTFSKRRCGLFKKASELCTLCGVEATIIVYSPGGKIFSFGHPNVETLTNRFLFSTPLPDPEDHEHIEDGQQNNINDLNTELTLMKTRNEAEKKKSVELSRGRKARGEQFWWDLPFEELKLQQLLRLKASLEELKIHVYQRGNKIVTETIKNNANNIIPSKGMVHPMIGFNPNPNPNPTLYNPNIGFGYHLSYNF